LQSLLFDLRIQIVDPIRPVYGCKDRLQAVVMLLRIGIKLVIVAACALNRCATEGVDGGTDHIVPIHRTSDLAVNFRLRNFNMSNMVPRTSSNKSQSDDSIRLTGIKDVASQLLFHKL